MSFFIFEHLLCTSLGQGLRIPERELWLRGHRLSNDADLGPRAVADTRGCRKELEGELLSFWVAQAGLSCNEWGPVPSLGRVFQQQTHRCQGTEVPSVWQVLGLRVAGRGWIVGGASAVIHCPVFVEHLLCARHCARPQMQQRSRQP